MQEKREGGLAAKRSNWFDRAKLSSEDSRAPATSAISIPTPTPIPARPEVNGRWVADLGKGWLKVDIGLSRGEQERMEVDGSAPSPTPMGMALLKAKGGVHDSS